jgi:hypothetical protein
MKRIIILFLLAARCALGAATEHDLLCAELAKTERSFCAQVVTMGIADAFLTNMADECFLPDSLALSGGEYESTVHEARVKAGAAYKPGPNPNVQLVWAPLKVDVSDDGSLGYTWVRYDYTAKGKDGKAESRTGIYLTIWKGQADRSWRFVYDGSPQVPDDPAALVKFLARGDLPRARSAP